MMCECYVVWYFVSRAREQGSRPQSCPPPDVLYTPIKRSLRGRRGVVAPIDARGGPFPPPCEVFAVRCAQIAAARGLLPSRATSGTSPPPVARDIPAIALVVASILPIGRPAIRRVGWPAVTGVDGHLVGLVILLALQLVVGDLPPPCSSRSSSPATPPVHRMPIVRLRCATG